MSYSPSFSSAPPMVTMNPRRSLSWALLGLKAPPPPAGAALPSEKIRGTGPRGNPAGPLGNQDRSVDLVPEDEALAGLREGPCGLHLVLLDLVAAPHHPLELVEAHHELPAVAGAVDRERPGLRAGRVLELELPVPRALERVRVALRQHALERGRLAGEVVRGLAAPVGLEPLRAREALVLEPQLRLSPLRPEPHHHAVVPAHEEPSPVPDPGIGALGKEDALLPEIAVHPLGESGRRREEGEDEHGQSLLRDHGTP